ncbi:MAG: DUF1273 family protein [Clostridia bacterium]|nr:DUF1273 family protein [Clostridia bacterium]
MQGCFIGHRTILKNKELKLLLKQTIRDLINKGVTTFLFGSKSEFDELSWEIVTELKKTYPCIKRVYVRSAFEYIDDFYEKYLLKSYEKTYFPSKVKNAGRCSYVERNYEMIDSSDYCIFYYDENYVVPLSRQNERKSGTKIAYNYAIKKKKNIINLYKQINNGIVE